MSSITATPYGEPLQIKAASPFNWWALGSSDLATWGEPFTLDVSLETPEARLHYDHNLVTTLTGTCWCRNLASEGFKIDLGVISLSFDASKEYYFKDPAAPTKFLTPQYGRKVTLTVGNSADKVTYIKSTDSSDKTNAQHRITFVFDGTSLLEVYLNGSLLFIESVSVNPTALVLSQFVLSVLPISDSKGEVELNSPWDLSLPLEPDYTIKAHPNVPLYPIKYIGYSPKVFSIELLRNKAQRPNTLQDQNVVARIGSAFVTINSEMNIPIPSITLGRNVSGYVTLQIVDANGNTINSTRDISILWGSQALSYGTTINGKFMTTIRSASSGSNFLQIIDGNGFEYSCLNPVNLTII